MLEIRSSEPSQVHFTRGQFSGEKFFSDLDALDAFIDENTSTAAPAQGWVCCLCGRNSINKLDIKRHVESKHCTTIGFR